MEGHKSGEMERKREAISVAVGGVMTGRRIIKMDRQGGREGGREGGRRDGKQREDDKNRGGCGNDGDRWRQSRDRGKRNNRRDRKLREVLVNSLDSHISSSLSCCL